MIIVPLQVNFMTLTLAHFNKTNLQKTNQRL